MSLRLPVAVIEPLEKPTSLESLSGTDGDCGEIDRIRSVDRNPGDGFVAQKFLRHVRYLQDEDDDGKCPGQQPKKPD